MKLFIVDDHEGFRAAAQMLLSTPDCVVVGESADGSDLVEHVLAAGADVVLIDVNLADLDGFDLVDQLAVSLPDVDAVMVSTRREQDYRSRLERSPAIGFISKAELSIERIEALRRKAHS